MASKLSFRARALDANRPLPVYRSEDEPDILKEAAINRGVMEMATGMEKEEEEEVHIRQVIQQENPLASAVVIPVPEAVATERAQLEGERAFTLPKQYIRSQYGMDFEDETPSYDIDSDDEKWLEAYNTGMKKTGKGKATAAAVKTLLPEKFELIFGRIEAMLLRGPVTDAELLAIAGTDQEEYRVVFDYARERIKKLNGLIVTPIIKPDNADGNSSRDAYVAFRKRTEKMQTRKNQKNVELSFVHMLKLHRDMIRCREVIEEVKKREKEKVELLQVQQKIIDARYHLRDWSGSITTRCVPAPPRPLPIKMQLPVRVPGGMVDSGGSAESQRTQSRSKSHAQDAAGGRASMSIPRIKRKVDQSDPSIYARPAKISAGNNEHSSSDSESSDSSAVTEDEYTHEEPFRLRRRFNMFYHAPLSELPSRASSAGQYQLARRVPDKTRGRRPVLRGFCRRRIGRGGRVFIDRCRPDFDFSDELTRVTKEQDDDLRLQQAKLQDYYAQRQREQRERSEQRKAELHGRSSVVTLRTTAPTIESAQKSSTAVDKNSNTVDTHVSDAAASAATPTAANGGPKDSPMPTTASSKDSSDAQLSKPPNAAPPAGADFGSGGENIASGPVVRVVGSADKSQAEWMPISVAAAAQQESGSRIKLAPSPTKTVKTGP